MATQGIGEHLECPICLDRYEAPKVLPCQHTFCLGCLGRIIGYRNVVKCPECRAEYNIPVTGVSGFPTNITIQRLLDADTLPNVPGPSTSEVSSHYTVQIEHTETQDQQQQGDDVEFQVAIAVSAEDERRRRQRGNQQNRNTTTTENESRRRLDDPENRSDCLVLKKTRESIRRVVGDILDNHKTMLMVFAVTFAIVTFSRFVAGAAKLSSDCDLERRAAVYLFAKACFAILFWGVVGVWKFKRILGEALDNPFIEAYLVIESLFSLCWLFVGTAWLFGNFNNINSQCPEYIYNWNGHFINFALFVTVVDYIGFVVFVFYCGYTICERETRTEITPI